MDWIKEVHWFAQCIGVCFFGFIALVVVGAVVLVLLRVFDKVVG